MIYVVAGLIQIPGNQARAFVEIARATARSGDVAGALRIARSISFVAPRPAAGGVVGLGGGFLSAVDVRAPSHVDCVYEAHKSCA